MKFDELLYRSLTVNDVALKEQGVAACLTHCTKNSIEYSTGFAPKLFDTPSYAPICRIVDPKELPKRKDLESNEGLAAMVHAIAHIEYSAIDLALDAVYRFPEMPLGFKTDWLVVAEDEIRHFKMLNELLEELGYSYGDFPVHSGLFEVSMNCADSVLERMAVVPRYYEAGGLDVNPKIIQKLSPRASDTRIARLIEHLNVILDEEINHVQKGDRWFRYACTLEGREDTEAVYMEVLDRYGLHMRNRPHINVSARKEAGFSCKELLDLGAKSCD